MQNNRPETVTTNKLIKRNNDTSISIFDFSSLYTKLAHEELLMCLHKSGTLSTYSIHSKYLQFLKFLKIVEYLHRLDVL